MKKIDKETSKREYQEHLERIKERLYAEYQDEISNLEDERLLNMTLEKLRIDFRFLNYDNVNRILYNINQYKKKIQELEQALNEIREYINTNHMIMTPMGMTREWIDSQFKNNILQIIDKALGDDSDGNDKKSL